MQGHAPWSHHRIWGPMAMNQYFPTRVVLLSKCQESSQMHQTLYTTKNGKAQNSSILQSHSPSLPLAWWSSQPLRFTPSWWSSLRTRMPWRLSMLSMASLSSYLPLLSWWRLGHREERWPKNKKKQRKWLQSGCKLGPSQTPKYKAPIPPVPIKMPTKTNKPLKGWTSGLKSWSPRDLFLWSTIFWRLLQRIHGLSSSLPFHWLSALASISLPWATFTIRTRAMSHSLYLEDSCQPSSLSE